MTRTETAKIEEAIRLLMTDEGEGGGFDKGMAVLCELVGRTYPPAMANPRTVSIFEAARDACAHEWIDARNEHVKSGYMCLRCGAIKGER